MADENKAARAAERHAVEMDLKRAELRKATADADKATTEAAAFQMDMVVKKELRQLTEASDRFHHTYYFGEQVNAKTVEECQSMLTSWSRMDPGCDIELILNSPGGSVLAGVALYDFLTHLRTSGHKLTITAQGIAASMAGVLLQAGDHRRMGRESWLLIHEGSIGAQGSFADVADTVEWFKKVQERFLDIFASRSNLTKATIKKNWSRKDWWLSSDECIKHGLVDEVM